MDDIRAIDVECEQKKEIINTFLELKQQLKYLFVFNKYNTCEKSDHVFQNKQI